MENFLNVIDWLYRQDAQFGVDHIVVGSRLFWLDSKTDRAALYELYLTAEN